MVTPSPSPFRKRMSIANTKSMPVTNEGLAPNWNVNAGTQSNVVPTGVITTDAQMDYAVKAMFYSRATRLAPTRHGAIYDVHANLTYLNTMFQKPENHMAFVGGLKGVPASAAARALVVVSRMPASKTWNAWLRYRVREAKMQRVLNARLTTPPHSAACSPVPLLYCAGVDHATGLYYVVMERPAGTLVPVGTLESTRTISLGTYRAIEAAIGSLWSVGAMLADTSAGNILVTTRRGAPHVAIVDYDSAIVLPSGLKERLYSQLLALYTTHRTGPCKTLKNTTERELVTLWDFVTRQTGDRASLKRLAVEVYGRRRWFPDVEMLRTLHIATRTASPRSRLAGTLAAALTSGRGQRSGFGGLRGFGRSAANDGGGSAFLDVKVRKIGALPEEEKGTWRRRERRPKTSSTRRRPVSASPAAVNANLSRPNRPNTVNANRNNNNNNNNNNNAVPMPSRGSGVGVANAAAGLVAQVNTSVHQQGLKLGMPGRANNAKNAKNARVFAPPTKTDFETYSSLDEDHQKHIVDTELVRFIKTDYYAAFKEKLGGGETFKETAALRTGILKLKPELGWKDMNFESKRRERRDMLDTVASTMARAAIHTVLTKHLSYTSSRDKAIAKLLDEAVGKTWTEWVASSRSLQTGLKWAVYAVAWQVFT